MTKIVIRSSHEKCYLHILFRLVFGKCKRNFSEISIISLLNQFSQSADLCRHCWVIVLAIVVSAFWPEGEKLTVAFAFLSWE